jgi:hypothetical protein
MQCMTLLHSLNRTSMLRTQGLRFSWAANNHFSLSGLQSRPLSLTTCSDQPARCLPKLRAQERSFATKKMIVDGAVISVDDGSGRSWLSDGPTAQSTGQNSIVVICMLKSKHKAAEVLLLSKYRTDLGKISIEPPACQLFDRENFKDAAFREVKAVTGYEITNFAPSTSSATTYSEISPGAKCTTKLIIAEIDLDAAENRNARLVHELGEKITVVRIPLGTSGRHPISLSYIYCTSFRRQASLPCCALASRRSTQRKSETHGAGFGA